MKARVKLSQAAEFNIRRSTSQSITSSIALADDNTLQFPIGVNEQWIAEYALAVTMSAAGGIGHTIIGPAGATGQIMWQSSSLSATQAYSMALGTEAGNVNLGTLAFVTLKVWIVNGATAGTIKLQFAQVVSDANATVHLTGSYLRAKRVAP